VEKEIVKLGIANIEGDYEYRGMENNVGNRIEN
jgi:hypothetical protein